MKSIRQKKLFLHSQNTQLILACQIFSLDFEFGLSFLCNRRDWRVMTKGFLQIERSFFTDERILSLPSGEFHCLLYCIALAYHSNCRLNSGVQIRRGSFPFDSTQFDSINNARTHVDNLKSKGFIRFSKAINGGFLCYVVDYNKFVR